MGAAERRCARASRVRRHDHDDRDGLPLDGDWRWCWQRDRCVFSCAALRWTSGLDDLKLTRFAFPSGRDLDEHNAAEAREHLPNVNATERTELFGSFTGIAVLPYDDSMGQRVIAGKHTLSAD